MAVGYSNHVQSDAADRCCFCCCQSSRFLCCAYAFLLLPLCSCHCCRRRCYYYCSSRCCPCLVPIDLAGNTLLPSMLRKSSSLLASILCMLFGSRKPKNRSAKRAISISYVYSSGILQQGTLNSICETSYFVW